MKDQHPPLFIPVSITKTRSEWKIIEEKISELGKKKFTIFVRSETKKLGNAYSQCPDCISKGDGGEKITKRPYIHADTHNKLKELAARMQLPVSTIVDIYIIMPLLMPPNFAVLQDSV